MKVLVTGGCGFIGTYLVNALIEKGYDVNVLDNLSTGKKENLNPKANLIVGDVRDGDDIKRAIIGCDAVFHLAAITNVRNDADDITYLVNFLGSKNVFEIAKSKKLKIIFTSSAAVYGNTPIPHKENADCNPISQYGKSKLRAERYLLAYYPENSFIVRMFNVYGPKSNSVINTFCKKITNYQDILVYGTGLQTRDYIYVSDAIKAMLLGLENTGLYNAGAGQDVSVTRLIDIIHEFTGYKPGVKFAPPLGNEIARSRADISKIKSLGWEPNISLEEGIGLVLESQGFKRGL